MNEIKTKINESDLIKGTNETEAEYCSKSSQESVSSK